MSLHILSIKTNRVNKMEKNIFFVILLYLFFIFVSRHHEPNLPRVKRQIKMNTFTKTQSKTLLKESKVVQLGPTPSSSAPAEYEQEQLPPPSSLAKETILQKNMTLMFVPKEYDINVRPTKEHDINVAIFVLSRRKSHSIRKVIRQTWASNHRNVFFVLGKCCPVPPKNRIKWTCKPSRKTLKIDQRSWDAKCKEEDKRIQNEMVTHNDIILMNEIDVYRHLPQKVKFAYKWGTKHKCKMVCQN